MSMPSDFTARLAEIETALGQPLADLHRETSPRDRPFSEPVEAIYCGSLTEWVGHEVLVLGLCPCHACTHHDTTRFAARIAGTSRVMRHSRPTSFILTQRGTKTAHDLGERLDPSL